MTNTIQVRDLSDLNERIHTNPDVLLSFSTPSCAKCKMLAPTVARLVDAADVDIQHLKVDLTEIPELIETYGVQEVPTLIRFKQGELVGRLTGIASGAELSQVIEGVS